MLEVRNLLYLLGLLKIQEKKKTIATLLRKGCGVLISISGSNSTRTYLESRLLWFLFYPKAFIYAGGKA